MKTLMCVWIKNTSYKINPESIYVAECILKSFCIDYEALYLDNIDDGLDYMIWDIRDIWKKELKGK